MKQKYEVSDYFVFQLSRLPRPEFEKTVKNLQVIVPLLRELGISVIATPWEDDESEDDESEASTIKKEDPLGYV